MATYLILMILFVLIGFLGLKIWSRHEENKDIIQKRKKKLKLKKF